MLFAEKCATCHTLEGRRRRRQVGPDLDVLAPPTALTVNAIKEGRAGKGQMPAQLLEDDEAKKVAKYIDEGRRALSRSPAAAGPRSTRRGARAARARKLRGFRPRSP